MELIDRKKLRGLYARLKGVQIAINSSNHQPRSTVGNDLNSIVQEIGTITKEELSHFCVPRSAFYDEGRYCLKDELLNKLMQAITYLEYSYHLGSEIIEIGALYNAIKDEELKARCSDLLSAPGKFDRVINQATQVLEDRIRTKAGAEAENLVGTSLVNAVLKADPEQSRLRVSSDKGEQEGFGHICRGIVGVFRNPAHHRLADDLTREEALKVCAFVDSLLLMIDAAQIQ